MQWQEYVIDDFVPCFPFSQPLFSKTIQGDLWVLLIEKCFAKAYSSYRNLVSGNCKSALLDLSGCPVVSYDVPVNNHKAIEFWETIANYKTNNYAITCGSKHEAKGKVSSSHAYHLRNVNITDSIVCKS